MPGTALRLRSARSSTSSSSRAVLRQDAQRVPRALPRVEVHAERAEAPGAELGRGRRRARGAARPRGARSSRGSGRGLAVPGMSPARSSSLRVKGRSVVDRLRVAQVAAEPPEAPEGELLLLDGLDLPARGEPEQEARAVAPGVAAVAAGEDHHHGAGPPVRPHERRHEAVALQEGGRARAASCRGGRPRPGRCRPGRRRGPAAPTRRPAGAPRAASRGSGRRPTSGPRAMEVEATASVSPQWSLWIENVCTVGSSAKMRRVPLPSCRSRSTTSTGSAKPRPRRRRIATATSLKTQKPEPGVGRRVVVAAAEVDGDPAGAQGEAGGLDRPARHQPLQVEGAPPPRAATRRRRGSG